MSRIKAIGLSLFFGLLAVIIVIVGFILVGLSFILVPITIVFTGLWIIWFIVNDFDED